MTVIPVNFSTEHKAMLGHTKMLFERGYLSINQKHDKLITSLRTAVENEGVLDKEGQVMTISLSGIEALFIQRR